MNLGSMWQCSCGKYNSEPYFNCCQCGCARVRDGNTKTYDVPLIKRQNDNTIDDLIMSFKCLKPMNPTYTTDQIINILEAAKESAALNRMIP